MKVRTFNGPDYTDANRAELERNVGRLWAGQLQRMVYETVAASWQGMSVRQVHRALRERQINYPSSRVRSALESLVRRGMLSKDVTVSPQRYSAVPAVERQVTIPRTSAEGAHSEITTMRRRLEQIMSEWTGFGKDPELTPARRAMLRAELAMLRAAAGDLMRHVRVQ